MEPLSKISKVYTDVISISQNSCKNEKRDKLKLKLKRKNTQQHSNIYEKCINMLNKKSPKIIQPLVQPKPSGNKSELSIITQLGGLAKSLKNVQIVQSVL